MCTDETIVSDVDVTIEIVDVVVRQDGGTECDDGVRPDVNATRVGFVELGTERNHGPFADIHFPDANEVEATEPEHEVPQHFAAPGRQGDRGVTDGDRAIFPIATVKSVLVRHGAR